MPRPRAHNISVSLDGYLAGPDQSPEAPLGVGGERLHDWIFAARTFRVTHGLEAADPGAPAPARWIFGAP